jgi:hypothetical protein
VHLVTEIADPARALFGKPQGDARPGRPEPRLAQSVPWAGGEHRPRPRGSWPHDIRRFPLSQDAVADDDGSTR